MAGNTDSPRPTPWGRRPYATAAARELMNDISRWIAREEPADVDDPSDPSLDDVIRYAGVALTRGGRNDPKAATLATLMGDHGLDFQEAVCWYWYAHSGMDLNQIHGAITGTPKGGHPDQRRDSIRNITSILRSAADSIPDADPSAIPDTNDDTT